MLNYDDSKDIIKKDKLNQVFKRTPELATYNGCRDFDDLLSDATEESMRKEHQFFKEWLTDLKKESAGYDKNQKIDLEIFEDGVKSSAFYMDEIRNWEKNPGIAEDCAEIIFFMLTREVDNQEKHFKNILERIKLLPKFIKQSEGRIKNPPKRYKDLAIQVSKSAPAIFDVVEKAAKDNNLPETLIKDIAKASAVVKEALKEHNQWLINVPAGAGETWVWGKDKFEKLLSLRKLGYTAKEILELGEHYLKKSKDERKKYALKITSSGNIDDARKIIGKDHFKNFEEALSKVRLLCDEARRYLIDKDLIDLPSNELLEIMETPEFLKHTIPFAALFTPSKFDPKQKGIYIVTSSSDPKFLEDNLNSAGIYNTAVHEAYPGHHLQISHTNLNCSIVRSAHLSGAHAIENVEGWAHYCEEMMKDQGFHDTAEGRFSMLDDQVWRACRIIIDVKLSSGEMSFDQAVQMLIDEAGKTKDGAISEVNRYIQSTGYILSYLFGKHIIKEIKEGYKKKLGSKYTEKGFHNAFLSCGTIPLHYVKKLLLS
ncbi:DUF885 domain-containing protein [bacterium]|nr:DUF885 domain-containing protein [bacterium]